MTYDLDTLIELENFLGPTALITLRDLHAAGYHVVKYDVDKHPASAPSPRKFKVGDCVKVLTGYYGGKIGVVILDDGDPEIESPYHVKFEDFRYPWDYCAYELELVTEAK